MAKNGFSILELMTTIGIIAVIGAVGFPAIDNFGEQENFENDLATIRGQVNYVRQLSLEEGNAYTIRIVNDNTNNTADLEVWQAQGLNRYNVEYHKSTSTKCSDFDGTNDKGTKKTDLTKKLEHMTVSRCTTTTGNCSKVSAANNFFVFYLMGLLQKMEELKFKHQEMLVQKQIIYIHINQVFLIMEKECEEI